MPDTTKTVRLVITARVNADLNIGGDDLSGLRTIEGDLNNASGSVINVTNVEMGGIDAATFMITEWYFSQVRDLAKSAPAEYAAEEANPEDRRDWYEFFSEYLDGLSLVTYTRLAKLVLMASDNEDAYQDEMGEAAPDVSTAALMALRADVEERINSVHPNIAEGRLSTEEEEEEEEAA